MTNHRNRFPARRRFLKQSAALSAGAAALAAPSIVLGQRPPPITIGLLHPVTGPLAARGVPCREGALMALADINAAGGIRSMGGAPIAAVLGDARSDPQQAAAQVEKLHAAGVAAIIGACASSLSLATTEAAARHGIAHIVDAALSDRIVERGLANTFRFGPGCRSLARAAMQTLYALNAAAGTPAKSVAIVHGPSAAGTEAARLIAKELPTLGFEIRAVVGHAAHDRHLGELALRMRAVAADIVIAAGHGAEHALWRALRRHEVVPMALYSVLGGAASSEGLAGRLADAPDGLIDGNHGYDPRDERVAALRARVTAGGGKFVAEFLMSYTSMGLLADALERAASARREDVIAALAASAYADHMMPYGPTRFVGGQNQGARPLIAQVQAGTVRLIAPQELREADAVFPCRA